MAGVDCRTVSGRSETGGSRCVWRGAWDRDYDPDLLAGAAVIRTLCWVVGTFLVGPLYLAEIVLRLFSLSIDTNGSLTEGSILRGCVATSDAIMDWMDRLSQ
jgi:hypothetical protein